MKPVIKLLRHKKSDGVSTWRVGAPPGPIRFPQETLAKPPRKRGGLIIKHFSKPGHRREIGNYRILQSLGIPTPRVIAQSRKTLLLEDLSVGAYRLATEGDMDDPAVGALVAAWYRQLHEKGREYAQTHELYDECELLTPENLALIGEKTGAKEFPIWPLLKEAMPRVREAALSLPRRGP